MATQTIEFSAPSGQTITARLFAAGSDTVAATASSVTERTNATGVYTATVTSTLAGVYRLVATNAAGTLLAQWWVRLANVDGTYVAYESPNADYLDAAVSSRLATVGYTAPLNTAGTAAAVWNALLASYTTAGSFGARVVRSVNSNNSLQITGSNHAAADVHEFQADVLTDAAIDGTAVTLLQSGLATSANQAMIIQYIDTEIAAIKLVTDRLNTGLVQDGAVWQFTVNMLENGPAGAGGGSATLENQELILANLDNVTGAVSAAVARLQLETQITGFPATICRGSDYATTLESEIRLQLLDLEENPIIEIGGTPVAEITWLFGFGTDRQPRLVSGACSWDGTTDELVIQLGADDTATTPLGAVTWQIGAQIGELIRWLGGGTTRVIERQFA